MKPSSFQTNIENQFDYICKRAMEDERKDYLKHLGRFAQREASFSDIGDYIANQFSTIDVHPADFHTFVFVTAKLKSTDSAK